MTIKHLGGVFGRNPTFNDVTIDNEIKLGDNKKAVFGDSQDLEIFHDGSNSHITDVGTGALIIDGSTSLQIKGSTFVIIRSSAGENMAVGNANGSFDLYFNGAKKLATSSSGITVTGTVTETSDRNEKQDIEALSDAERRVALSAKGLLRKFRWRADVEERGDSAEIYFGIIAQDLQSAFEAEGLDADQYGVVSSITWTDEETGEEYSRLGVHYSGLLAFIISAI